MRDGTLPPARKPKSEPQFGPDIRVVEAGTEQGLGTGQPVADGMPVHAELTSRRLLGARTQIGGDRVHQGRNVVPSA